MTASPQQSEPGHGAEATLPDVADPLYAAQLATIRRFLQWRSTHRTWPTSVRLCWRGHGLYRIGDYDEFDDQGALDVVVAKSYALEAELRERGDSARPYR